MVEMVVITTEIERERERERERETLSLVVHLCDSVSPVRMPEVSTWTHRHAQGKDIMCLSFVCSVIVKKCRITT